MREIAEREKELEKREKDLKQMKVEREHKEYSTDRTQPNRKRIQTGPRVRFQGPVGVR